MEMMDVLAANREGNLMNWIDEEVAVPRVLLPALLNQVVSYNYPGLLNQKWPSKENQTVNLKEVIKLMADQVSWPACLNWIFE